MFELEKSIYLTRTISEELSQEHLYFIIQYISEHQEQLTDYLQIFEFYIENDQQWLIQRQEEQNHKTTIFMALIEVIPIERKVWVMDQGNEGIIILFPEDY